MTHVFVAYNIKRDGEALANGGLAVNFTESTLVLENSSTGEILTEVELANAIDPANSAFTCSTKKVEIKLKKVAE